MEILDSYNKAYYSLASTHNTINIEFELRITNFDYFKFIDVVNQLNKFSNNDNIKQYQTCEIENTMNALIEEPIELKPSNTKLKDASLIMTMKFDTQGKKMQYSNGEYKSYSRKWRINRSNEMLNPLFKYSINVSGEQAINTDIKPDSNSLIRIKCRLSYYIEIMSQDPANSRKWRIDLTITKQFQAFNSTDISLYIQKMFKHDEPMDPNNFMRLLKLDDIDARQLYNYELEIEYMNPDKVIDRSHSLTVSDINDIVKFISSITQSKVLVDTKYQSVIYDIAKHIITNPEKLKRFKHDLGIKQLLPNVIPLTANTYKDIYPPTQYYLLDKADGVRSVLIINENFMYLISDKLIEFELSKKYNTTIVDGEFIGNTLYIFDVIMCDGNDLTKLGYEIRNDSIELCVDIFETIKNEKITINVAAKPRVYITDFKPDDLKRQFNDPVLKNRPYETDGLIMVKPDNNYMMTITYKWKSVKNNTIDFLIKKVPQHLIDNIPEQLRPKPGFVLYYLFVGISTNMFNKLGLYKVDGYDEIFKSDGYKTTDKYFPIQFSISDSPFAYFYYAPDTGRDDISGKYVEMRCGGGCDAAGNLGMPNWEFVKIRDDRAREKSNYFGNDYKTAEINWTNYLAPFKKEQLWNGPTGGYFMTVKNKLYKDQTAFTSFVKSQRINTMTNYNWVVDAAIGKGQDFLRYVNANIRHLVGIDIDQIALTELIRRKLQNAGAVIREYNNPLTLFILNADLSKDYTGIAKKIKNIEGYPVNGANAIVINLAIHYMCDTIDHITNFVNLCEHLVAPGGKVVITAMFGDLVHKLLMDNNVETGNTWSKYQDGVLKYSIRKDYTSKEMVDVGQPIGVLLPFSVGDYYVESLVNTDYLVSLYDAHGFDLVEKVPFSKYFKIYETQSQSRFRQLTPDDLEFLSLYGEIILKKR